MKKGVYMNFFATYESLDAGLGAFVGGGLIQPLEADDWKTALALALQNADFIEMRLDILELDIDQ